MLGSPWHGLAAVAVLVAAAPTQNSKELAPPVKLQADGKVIDTVADIGHAGPLLRDVDGDGVPELLVSSFGGTIRCFRNTGTREQPRFVEQQPLQAEGEAIRIHNW